MFIFTYTAAVLATIIAVAAAFLFFRTKRTTLINAFILELVMAASWIGSNAAADVATTDPVLIFWCGIAHMTGLFMLSFFLYFVDVFIDGKAPPMPKLIAYFGPAAVLSLFSFSSYAVVETIYPENMPAQIVPGVLYQIYLLILIVATAYGVWRLIRHAARTHGPKRVQTIHLIVGFSTFFFGAIFFNIVLPIMGELRFFNVGPQLAIVLCVASAYAVFKHQLLDLRTWVQRGIIYSILFTVIVFAYAALLIMVTKLTDLTLGAASPISAVLIIAIGLLIAPTLEAHLRRLTDRFFFKDDYDYSGTLESLSEVLNAEIEVMPLLEKSLSLLAESLKLESAEFRKAGNGFVVRASFGEADGTVPGLCEPVRVGNEDLGMLCMGVKRSGDPIAHADATLLRTFASQLAVSLKKAELYQELKDYSADLEKKVAERTAHLERNQKHQRQMIEDAAHEVQTPLAIIKTTVELMMRSGEHDGIKSDLTMIDKSVDNLSRLVSGFLHLARLETEHGRVRHTDFPLSDLVNEVVEFTQVICRDAGIELKASIQPNVSMLGRRDHVAEVLTNLLSNAVKYTRDSETRRVRISLKCTDTHAEIRVEDTGMGIPLEDVPHLFKRFYRGRSQTGITKGSGLGLAICRRIVKQHAGELIVESAGVGRGSTFTIRFPIERITKTHA